MSYIGDVGRLDSTINSDFSKYTYEYIATEGQTVFTGTDINSATLGYTAGNVLVTYGGADLAFSDYTATDGTSVVLADGAVAGKIIRVVAFQAFEVADAYTKAQADDLLAIKATLASPSFTGTVDVAGPVSADGLVVSGNSYVGSGNTFTDATSGYFFAGNGQYTNGIYGVGVNNVAIAAGGSERMRIDSSGDITTTGNLTIDGFGSGKDISFRSGYGSDNVGIRAKAITTANRDGLEILGYNGIDLTVNNGAKVAVHVDAVGRVTTPYQPSFRAYSPPITVAGNTIIWASTAHNITSSFSTSTGLFTAPVAGTYYFSHSILVRYVSPHYARVVWILNGSTAMINGDNLTDMPGPSYVSVGLSISVYMSANDTIGVVNTGAETYGPGYGHFSGHLLG